MTKPKTTSNAPHTSASPNSTMDLQAWAVPRLQTLLSLDEDSLRQIVEYAATLSREAAGNHFKELLGESAPALEFLTAFNSRLPPSPSTPAAITSSTHVPAAPRKTKKKKPPLNKFPTPARKANEGTAYESADIVSKGYTKTNEEEVYAGPGRSAKVARKDALAVDPEGPQGLRPKDASSSASSRNPSPSPARNQLPPGAQGSLVSDVLKPRTKKGPASAFATTPKARKVHITGGTPMHGQSSMTSDLDSAIRALEIQTNPTLSSKATSQDEVIKRKCNCMALRHPLLAAAPNCLNCGKIICVKEGLGPCTFCGNPLLSGEEIQSMVQILREERGKEKMEAHNVSHKRAEVSNMQQAFASKSRVSTPATSESERENDGKLAAAKQHRDKLLGYQATSARRTHIIDESADFEIPSAGQSMWATPQERALQLKKQQKVLREQEWQAKPEWEKRRMVVSVDLVGGKVIKRMAQVEKPEEPEDSADNEVPDTRTAQAGSGSFSNNPLLGGLIKPVYKASKNTQGTSNGKPAEDSVPTPAHMPSTWRRRVQDDADDNEQWILNGGAYGGKEADQAGARDEPPCG